MTRRIVVAIVTVTALSVVAFAAPLGLIIARLYQEQALVHLDRQATASTIGVPANLRRGTHPVGLPAATGDLYYGLYLPDGTRVDGQGPRRGDDVVRQAASGKVAQARGRRLLVAVPVFSHEDVVAIMRASSSVGPLRHKVLTAWLAMGALGIAIVGMGAALALALARRLHQPVEALVHAAAALGDGDFAARAPASGIAELDQAADALNSTAARLGAVVERERSFSADASHQLRTPLTGLRMHLEELRRSLPGPDDHVDRALLDVGRLDQTITDLLLLARDSSPGREPLDLDALFADLEGAWRRTLDARHRELVVRNRAEVPEIRASAAAVRQILDVLVSNAVEHGAGSVTVTVREVAGSAAIDVTDQGTAELAHPDQLFVRRSGDRPGHGIGLALARTLAEAEGGRLLLRDRGPGPTFTLLFPS